MTTRTAGPTTPEYRKLRNMLVGVSVLIFLTLGAIWQDGKNAEHSRCEQSNAGRAAIRDAFGDLYDGFITASGGSKAAVDFKAQRMAALDKKLPQRKC